jgi:hypothetical protein
LPLTPSCPVFLSLAESQPVEDYTVGTGEEEEEEEEEVLGAGQWAGSILI